MFYKHCVMGPVSMPSMNIGYPDGDNRPTVTMDYRRTYTLKPNTSGQISFGLGTSYYGCFVKGVGTLTSSTAIYPCAITSSGGFSKGSATSTLGLTDVGLVPILEPTGLGNGKLPAYRPIVAVGEVTFTGSSMENGGAVTVCKTSMANPPNGVFGSAIEVTEYGNQYPNPVMNGTSVVGAARDTYISRVVPADPEFIPFQVSAILQAADSSAPIMNGLVSTGYTSTDRKVASMPCTQAGAVWYSYSGLHSSASITVNVRYCVQYAVHGDSEMVPISRPSPPPPENPGVLSRMFSAITGSPAALQFAANTVGHLVPASRPFLAIAADAYNAH